MDSLTLERSEHAAAVGTECYSSARLEALPHELLLAVCHHLPHPDGLLAVMPTCMALHAAACDASLWTVVRLGACVAGVGVWTVERIERLLRRHGSETTELHCFGLRCMDDEAAAVLEHAPSLTALHMPQCSKLSDHGAAIIARICQPRLLRTLNLSDCHRITDHGVIALTRAFGACLEEVTLAGLHRVTAGAIEILAAMCPRIQSLDVSGCDQLTDDGLARLAACTALRRLNLAGLDHLSDLSPLHALPHLEHLNLADCDNLDDSTVAALLHRVALTSLSVAGLDELGAASCRALATQQRLTQLSVAGCAGICANDWRALKLPALTDLSIAGCAVDDVAITDLSCCSGSLTSLNLRSCNRLTAAGLHAVASYLPALTDLNLSKIRADSLTDEALAQIAAGCPRLQRLHAAASDSVGFKAMSAVACLSALRDLCVAGCGSVGNECLLALGSGGCTALECVDLSGCVRCRDSGLRALTAGCPRLESLFVMGLRGLSDVGVRHAVRNCPSLTSICLMDCTALTDEALMWLGQLASLRLLNLGSCAQISSLGLQCLAQGCRLLQSLDLSNCSRVDAEGLQAVCDGCTLLHSLNVQGVRASVTNAVQWRGWQSQTWREPG
jgi:hypothetical protein